MQTHTKAVVIGARDIDEEDRILTLLSKELGVVHAYANGANRLRSRLAASTSLFCYADMVLFYRKERYTVDYADSLEQFFGLRGDLERLSLATYFAELTAALAPQGEPAEEFLRLLLNSLHLLAGEKSTVAFLKPVFELRALTLSGYMPNLVACRSCACYEAPRMYFLLEHGELLCGTCMAQAGGQLVAPIEVPTGVLTAMRHCIYSPLEKLFGFYLPPESLGTLGQVAERYLIHQTERSYASLDFYKSL